MKGRGTSRNNFSGGGGSIGSSGVGATGIGAWKVAWFWEDQVNKGIVPLDDVPIKTIMMFREWKGRRDAIELSRALNG